MVIDNQIPKTETVYELKEKYEVPSFEEFMKTYEHDENLNYEDLNSGSLGESRGYGPCYVCDKPERETYLKVACPVVSCTDRNPKNWYHS
jgi:hypothetical protein